MMISANSQLGLRFKSNDVKVAFLKTIKVDIEGQLQPLTDLITHIQADIKEAEESGLGDGTNLPEGYIQQKYQIPLSISEKAVSSKVMEKVDVVNLVSCEDSSFYLIAQSVYKAAELIKVSENFSSRTLKDINIGKYTYLLGKNKMIRFVCVVGAIKGFYYDDVAKIAFEWGCDLDTGEYFFNASYQDIFSQIMQILTFVELGDIEVITLEGGRNNGNKDKATKIHNSSNNTVYVVDSTWNQILIRTEGFAVRGHFKLQPCGPGNIDRKLIWIDAFEKHGYKRRPKAEIVR